MTDGIDASNESGGMIVREIPSFLSSSPKAKIASHGGGSVELSYPARYMHISQNTAASGQRHLFVVGFYRSGTSLLYSLLNLHPQIKLVYEADILGNPLLSGSSWSGQDWWKTLDFFNACVRRHQLRPTPSWKQARTNQERADVLYHDYAGTEPLYLGEKCPAYYNRLRYLANLYPDARFISIWRNPLGITSGIFNAGKGNCFFSKRSLHIRAVLGVEQLQNDTLSLRRQGRAIFDLCYEDLVDDPEGKLRSICDFLEIEFNPVMLELKNADSSMFPCGEHHSKAKSGRITATVHAPEPALQAIHAKINRYLARWRNRFHDKLASRRYWLEAAGDAPGLGEVIGDRLAYVTSRVVDERLTPSLFGILPQSWLQKYRRVRKNSDI